MSKKNCTSIIMLREAKDSKKDSFFLLIKLSQLNDRFDGVWEILV